MAANSQGVGQVSGLALVILGTRICCQALRQMLRLGGADERISFAFFEPHLQFVRDRVLLVRWQALDFG